MEWYNGFYPQERNANGVALRKALNAGIVRAPKRRVRALWRRGCSTGVSLGGLFKAISMVPARRVCENMTGSESNSNSTPVVRENPSAAARAGSRF